MCNKYNWQCIFTGATISSESSMTLNVSSPSVLTQTASRQSSDISTTYSSSLSDSPSSLDRALDDDTSLTDIAGLQNDDSNLSHEALPSLGWYISISF